VVCVLTNSENDISNVGIQCRPVVFYNKLSWFVSELPEKVISNVGFLAINIVRFNYS
jgi:hypothetical protein